MAKNNYQPDMRLVFRGSIDMFKQSIGDSVDKLSITWINPMIDDVEYPYLDSFTGKWEVEVFIIEKKMKFEEIVHELKKDSWQPASVYHLLTLLSSVDGQTLDKSMMAPGSLCIDDFEYPGCIVLNIEGNDKKLGLGNWRGSKISEYDVVRVRKY